MPYWVGDGTIFPGTVILGIQSVAWRARLTAFGLFVALSLANIGAAAAQPEAQAIEGAVGASQKLTLEAMHCLQQGEEASDVDAKLAAYRRGVELAHQAVAADDNSADAHFALFANNGRVLIYEGYTANPATLMSVNRELNRTLEINPNHADALAAKGGMYRQLPWALGGSKQKASEYLARSVELDYEHACGARIELAELYRDLGQPERGIPLLEKAVEVATRDKKPDKLERARALLRELAGGDAN